MGVVGRSLVGKVVVVTGGGRGIGAATAEALGRAGARVAVGDLELGVARRVAERVGAEAFALDVTDRAGFTKFFEEVEGRLGPVDVVINNAGIMALGPFEEESDRSTVRQLEINLHGVIHGTREAVKRMRPRRTGHIVNIASAAGKAGFAGGATYCATKHGVVGLSEAVRAELRGSGVEVTVVMPAVVRTELASGLKEARFFTSVEAADVADAIVKALRHPKFEVYVPSSLGAMNRITRLLPRAATEWLARALKSDRILFDTERAARAAYEARAAASAPGAENETTT